MDSRYTPLNNPFSILRVSADSLPNEIESASQQLMIKHRLSNENSSEELLNSIQTASNSLKDSVKRFAAGCYWLTLTDEELDLWKDRLDELFSDHWSVGFVESYDEIANSEERCVTLHNRAVLHLGVALSCSVEDDFDTFELSWKSAFESWNSVIESDDFLSFMITKCDEFDDPRLTPQSVSEWMSTIQGEILYLCQSRASNQLVENNVRAAKRYIEAIKNSAFDKGAVNKALENIFSPIAKRVIIKLDTLNEKLDESSKHKSVLSSELICGEVTQIFESFKSEVIADLDIFVEVGDLPGLSEEFALDESAKLLHSLSISFNNDADDLSLAEEALGLAIKYVDSQALSLKLDKTKEVLVSNKRLESTVGICAWCKKNKSKGNSESITLFGPSERVGGFLSRRYQYATVEIPLPCCSRCEGPAKIWFTRTPIGHGILLAFILLFIIIPGFIAIESLNAHQAGIPHRQDEMHGMLAMFCAGISTAFLTWWLPGIRNWYKRCKILKDERVLEYSRGGYSFKAPTC